MTTGSELLPRRQTRERPLSSVLETTNILAKKHGRRTLTTKRVEKKAPYREPL
jgi:histone H3/H4